MSGEVHGSQTRVHFAGYDLSSNLRENAVEETLDVADKSVFTDVGKTYLVGQSDGTATADGFYTNVEGGLGEAITETKRSEDAIICCWPEGDAIGSPGEGLGGVTSAKSVETPIGDVVKASLQLQQSGTGVEEVVSLHAMGSEAADDEFATVDQAAGSASGGVAYLHAPVGPTSADIIVQHSEDDSVWEDLITFAVDADHSYERAVVTGDVDRYVRVILDNLVEGPVTFAVAFGRYPDPA